MIVSAAWNQSYFTLLLERIQMSGSYSYRMEKLTLDTWLGTVRRYIKCTASYGDHEMVKMTNKMLIVTRGWTGPVAELSLAKKRYEESERNKRHSNTIYGLNKNASKGLGEESCECSSAVCPLKDSVMVVQLQYLPASDLRS